MANWDSHNITFVGPMDDIHRCAEKLAIQVGRLNDQNEPIAEYGGRPSINFGEGRYFATDCWVGEV